MTTESTPRSSSYPDPSFHLSTTPSSLQIHHFLPTSVYSNFLNTLYNTDLFIAGEGDTGINTPEKALSHIQEWVPPQFAKNGYGTYVVSIPPPVQKSSDEAEKETAEFTDYGIPIGTISLMRGHYTCPDIGFAFLPAFTEKGYATEAGKRILSYAITPKSEGGLGLDGVFGFTSPKNSKSKRVCERLGLEYRGVYPLDAFGGKESACYAMVGMEGLEKYGIAGKRVDA